MLTGWGGARSTPHLRSHHPCDGPAPAGRSQAEGPPQPRRMAAPQVGGTPLRTPPMLGGREGGRGALNPCTYQKGTSGDFLQTPFPPRVFWRLRIWQELKIQLRVRRVQTGVGRRSLSNRAGVWPAPWSSGRLGSFFSPGAGSRWTEEGECPSDAWPPWRVTPPGQDRLPAPCRERQTLGPTVGRPGATLSAALAGDAGA